MTPRQQAQSDQNLEDATIISRPGALGDQKPRRGYGHLALLVCTLAFSVALRWKLLDIPLERDEGDYAYGAQMLLRGFHAYQDFYTVRLPGIYFIYTLILLAFGQTHVAIHTGLLIVNLATAVLIYWIGAALYSRTAGNVAAFAFVLLSVLKAVLGFSANSEHFVLFFGMAGFAVLCSRHPTSKGMLLFSGTLFTLATFVKQHGAAYILFGLLLVAVLAIRNRQSGFRTCAGYIAWFSIGVAIPVAALGVLISVWGVWDSFLFWTLTYAREYSTGQTLSAGLRSLAAISPVAVSSLPFIILASIGLLSALWDKSSRQIVPRMLGLLVATFAMVSLGFYYRPHYFIYLAGPVALLAGVGAASLAGIAKNRRVRLACTSMMVILTAGYCLWDGRAYFFQMTPLQISRAVYGINPFLEAPEIGQYLNEHTEENDTIAILGSEPEITFYSKRSSATAYMHMYPLMETHAAALSMHQEFVEQIETAKPSHIVFVSIPTSWLKTEESETLVLDWLADYLDKNYVLVGAVDFVSNEGMANIYWEGANSLRRIRGNEYILVFQRRDLSGM